MEGRSTRTRIGLSLSYRHPRDRAIIRFLKEVSKKCNAPIADILRSIISHAAGSSENTDILRCIDSYLVEYGITDRDNGRERDKGKRIGITLPFRHSKTSDIKELMYLESLRSRYGSMSAVIKGIVWWYMVVHSESGEKEVCND